MKNDTSKILDQWAKVLEFNTDQKSFNLGDFSLDIYCWRSNEMKEDREQLDESEYINRRMHRCIGFSKRGLNKLVKDPSIVITYNDDGKLIAKED